MSPENSQSIHSAPYRAGPKAREHEWMKIKKMLSQQVIEPAHMSWLAPILFAPRKGGSLPFCVDYRRLTAVTKRDSYPIPCMDKCINYLGEVAVFSTPDANSGNWQVKVDEADQDKTAFTDRHGLCRFLRMPFGFKNAPRIFHRAMKVVLSPEKWQYAIVNLDNIVVFFRSPSNEIA